MPDNNSPRDKEIVYALQTFPAAGGSEDEIDLIELWQIIWNAKFFIISFVIICTLIAGVISYFVLPKEYKSTATLIPANQKSSSLGGLGSLVGNLPLPIALPGQGTSNIMSFLQSRTLKERLISNYDLLPVLYKDLWNADKKEWTDNDPRERPTLIKALQEEILDDFFSVSQDGNTELITISWASEDPSFCSLMLERVIKELTFFLENEYTSDAREERGFVEEQLDSATKELEYWERQVPSEKLTLSKITRERLASQTVYTELRKQLELAKITEAKELETFKVLDRPYVPEKPFKPKKLLIVALTCILSSFIATFIIFFFSFMRNLKKEETPPIKES